VIRVKMDTIELSNVLKNTVKYSQGFLKGVELDRIRFMVELAQYIKETLDLYIDAQARGNPSALHHVYEWGQVGSQSGRLFEIDAIPSLEIIRFSGKFLPSSSISDTATEPFVDKANIMENAISITISPRFSDYLVFEDGGQTIFTMNEITIAHPGGDGVAGSFGRTVESFFGNYLTNAIMQPFLRDLATAEEYVQYFPQGAKGGGFSVGVKAGKLYLSSAGMRAL
jgi:hypothetical protein